MSSKTAAVCTAQGHRFTKFDDKSIFCASCGEVRDIEPRPVHVCPPCYSTPCYRPHYDGWYITPQVYPTFPTIWCGTTTGNLTGPFTVVS